MTVEQQVKLIIGDLTVVNIALRAEIEKLKAELEKLKLTAPQPSE